MIFSVVSLVNLECRVGKNGIVHTKLLFAIFLEHPALILELKGISEDWKTLWTRWNFAPWAARISYRQNDDEAQNETNTGGQKLGEYGERKTMEVWVRTTEGTCDRITSNLRESRIGRHCSGICALARGR